MQPLANPEPCAYNLTVTLLPFTLRHGMEFDAYLQPIEAGAGGHVHGLDVDAPTTRHYFHVAITAYETFQLSLERRPDGSTLSVERDTTNQVVALQGPPQELFDEATGESLGVGFQGGIYIKRLGGACPTNFTAPEGLGPGSQSCELGLNDTAACVLGQVCTALGGGLPPPPPPPSHLEVGGEGETLDLAVMVQAEIGASRPGTEIDNANSPWAVVVCETSAQALADNIECEYVANLVDKDGQRPLVTSIPDEDGALVGKPQHNVPSVYMDQSNWEENVQNELRIDRAVYRLRVTQLLYEEGELMQNEGRPGCVAFGQMRRYTIRTTSARDAALSLHALSASSQGLGAVYVGENFAPSEGSYTVPACWMEPEEPP